MIVSFVCPGGPTPLGGVTAMYEYANGLQRRGHEIHIAHGAFWGRPGVASLDEITWFEFEPGIHHHFGGAYIDLPEADIIFGTGAPPELGLPVLLVQGFEMFPEELEREVFRTPCLKVCVASWLCKVGVRYGVPPEQLVFVPMGIDHETFRLHRPIEERDLMIGILYSSHPAKGWVDGLPAIERVHASFPGVRAVVFGTEPLDSALPDWVTFVHNPDRDVLARDIYNACRVFVQPSVYEGFGFTAVEAMACGCALVTTDNGGSDDYAIDGETALLAAPRDVDGLAAQIERLLRDDAERVRLARAGQAYVQKFRWDRGAELLEIQLQRYLADPSFFRQPPLDDVASQTAGD